MAGIRISEIGRAIVYRSVPWSKSPISMKRESFPKGSVPKHLEKYLLTSEPRTCASQTAGKAGSARVQAMNSCISKLRRGK